MMATARQGCRRRLSDAARPWRGPAARPAAVRSTALQREAGNRAERFTGASSSRAIRDVRISDEGACRDGRRSSWVLLAAGAQGMSGGRFPAVRSRTLAAQQDDASLPRFPGNLSAGAMQVRLPPAALRGYGGRGSRTLRTKGEVRLKPDTTYERQVQEKRRAVRPGRQELIRPGASRDRGSPSCRGGVLVRGGRPFGARRRTA